MSKIAPCVWMNGTVEQAAALYLSTFGGEVIATSFYGEGMPLPAGTPLVIELALAGHRLQLLNGGPQFQPTPAISLFAHTDDETGARRVYDALSVGGLTLMPLGAYPWSPCYAWIQDRFGVSWQIITGRRPPSGATLVPCLMFANDQAGRAADAIDHYVGLLPGSRVDSIERYVAGEGPEGFVKHGRMTLGGVDLVAMDSHIRHAFDFGEGVSLSVSCADQAEVDQLWNALTEGGAPGPCGWLKDRFGVSWQIVPEGFVALQRSGDEAAKARMFQAMMGMTRLDLAALERAFAG